jgi:PAS domain-containing protein
LNALAEAVLQTQRSSRAFAMSISARGSRKSLAVRGNLADPLVAPTGSAQLWFFDNTATELAVSRMRVETAQAKGDFAALSGLIEAAPMPMWFRGTDGALRLVNSAYVRAVAAQNAQQVVAEGIELVERIEGLAPPMWPRRPRRRASPSSVWWPPPSTASAAPCASPTCRWARGRGRLRRRYRGYGGAEPLPARLPRGAALAARSAVFGCGAIRSVRQLVFANQPFQRLFGLHSADMQGGLGFERWLDVARDIGRVPERATIPPGAAIMSAGSPRMPLRMRHGRSRTAPICASRPSPCPMAACC